MLHLLSFRLYCTIFWGVIWDSVRHPKSTLLSTSLEMSALFKGKAGWAWVWDTARASVFMELSRSASGSWSKAIPGMIVKAALPENRCQWHPVGEKSDRGAETPRTIAGNKLQSHIKDTREPARKTATGKETECPCLFLLVCWRPDSWHLQAGSASDLWVIMGTE